MPDATITSTASTFGTISGTFAADQSTIVGTVTGIVAGTLDGSVGVPGPAGEQGPVGPVGPPGPPGVGGTWGSILGDITTQVDLWGQLQSKAPIASPVFTGDARAVTPAFGDNDTSIATTAFVQSALAGGTAVAKNLEVEVRNQSGSTIPAGSIVYISGATGNKPLITLAQANNDTNSAQTIGFVKTSIANNGTGFVIVRGELENIDTSALTEGVQLYLSPTTAGTWTTTKPSAPQHLVYVGIVIRSHPTLGIILVAVQNGYELGEIHDVALSGLANNDLLAYESSTDLWKNKTFSALGLLTSADAASTYYLASNPSGFITYSALTGYATESWVTSGFYPLTGNPSGFIDASYLSGYAALTGADFTGRVTIASVAGGPPNFNIGNVSGVTGMVDGDIWKDIAGLHYYDGSDKVLATETFVTSQNYLQDAPSDGNQYARKDGAWDIVSAGTSYITSVSSPLAVTSGDLSINLTAYAPLASPALTGNVTITTNSASPALFVTQTGTGNILTLHDQASDTTFVAIDQNGKINTIASTTANAGFNVPHGTAPTTPVNGDIWTTTGNIQWRRNGGTQSIPNLGTTNVFGAGAKQTFTSSSTATGTNFAPIATDPSTLVNGDIWLNSTSNDLKIRINGVSETVAEQSWVTSQGYLTSAPVTSVAGKTGAVTLVVADVSGAAPLASPALTGTPLSTTAAADTNTTQIATTAYVVGQAGSATPLVNGTAAVGTSLRYARQDHVHPTDTTRAASASPTFTGVPAAPTAAVDTNTTQLATTAYVVAQAAAATPLVDGTAAVGTSLRYARADHVHPTDTTRAALNSPTFTGTPSLPTGTTAVTQTAGNNTTAVATTAFVQQEVPAASTTAAGKVELATRLEVVEPSSSTLAVSPMRALDVLMNPGYVQIAQNNGNVSTATVGTGAGVFTTSMTRVCIGPNVSVAGSSYYRPQTNGGVAQFYAKGINNASINFSKPFWMSGRSSYDDTFRGDANNISRITVGKSAVTVGALVQKGIGWQKVGGLAPNFFLLAHNGTTLTSVDTSTSLNSLGITGGVPFDWSLYSDGSGNVTMFINNVQVATTSAGPTGYSTGSSVWQEEIDQTASAATRMYFTTFGGHYYHA